jgi:hypothetical protein
MTSIFRQALGADFARLHPRLQHRFGVGLDTGEGCVGTGVMDRIWHGGAYVRPFLRIGGTRNILVPETGREVPFTIENYPYTDSYGRETVTFVRTFDLPGRLRRFDATMIYSEERGGIVDYLGTHQHLATDLALTVDERGGLVIRSGEHRFHEGPVGLRLPALITGEATVRESFDDSTGRFRIEVNVVNRRFGPLFGYHGSFTTRHVDAGRIPAGLRPSREEARV